MLHLAYTQPSLENMKLCGCRDKGGFGAQTGMCLDLKRSSLQQRVANYRIVSVALSSQFRSAMVLLKWISSSVFEQRFYAHSVMLPRYLRASG
jgi:hypothetical protein